MTSMGAAAIWGVIAVAGAGTFLLRLSFVGALAKADRIPDVVLRALRLVPAAVLAALVTPSVARPDGGVDLLNGRMLAAFVALLVAWRTKNMLATVGAGMIVLWALQAI